MKSFGNRCDSGKAGRKKRGAGAICLIALPRSRAHLVVRQLAPGFLLAVIIWLGATLAATAQPRDVQSRGAVKVKSGWQVTTWETEDGLPENSATSMVQTKDGYLWFGTFNGLVRFDGVKCTI